MKTKYWFISGSLLIAALAGAESRRVEMKGRIQDLDAVIEGMRIESGSEGKFFSVGDDVLIRERLTRLHYSDLHPGDVVEVRYWEDNDKVDRIDVLEREARTLTSATGPSGLSVAASVP